jgi:hypothetical protein
MLLPRRRLALSHPPDIPLRRSAKQAAVLAAELGGTLITHEPPGVACVETLVEHQLPRLLQTQWLLDKSRILFNDDVGSCPDCFANRREYVRIASAPSNAPAYKIPNSIKTRNTTT